MYQSPCNRVLRFDFDGAIQMVDNRTNPRELPTTHISQQNRKLQLVGDVSRLNYVDYFVDGLIDFASDGPDLPRSFNEAAVRSMS